MERGSPAGTLPVLRKEVYMKTLIELFDIRPIENVLGTEVFRPQETIVLFPPEAGSEKLLKKTSNEEKS